MFFPRVSRSIAHVHVNAAATWGGPPLPPSQSVGCAFLRVWQNVAQYRCHHQNGGASLFINIYWNYLEHVGRLKAKVSAQAAAQHKTAPPSLCSTGAALHRPAAHLARRAELEMFDSQMISEMTRVADAKAEDREWERHIACKYLPKPWDLKAMRTYEEDVASTKNEGLHETFVVCQDLHDLATQCQEEALQASHGDDTAHFYASADKLRALINKKMDAASARILMFMDEYFANGEVKTMTNQPPFSLGVWVNLAKNPRFRTVEYTDLGVTVEIPKPVALASLAVRVQLRAYDERFYSCTNQFMALGGVLLLDMLALPGQASKGNNWTIREVRPGAGFLGATTGRVWAVKLLLLLDFQESIFYTLGDAPPSWILSVLYT